MRTISQKYDQEYLAHVESDKCCFKKFNLKFFSEIVSSIFWQFRWISPKFLKLYRYSLREISDHPIHLLVGGLNEKNKFSFGYDCDLLE